ncbi:hypothetical protein [Citrobacter phage Ci1]|nr:hypothetical protein [Citrobacter phage Ci1]
MQSVTHDWRDKSRLLSEKLKDPVFMEEYKKRLEKSLKDLENQMEIEAKARILTPEMLNRTYTL